MNIQEQIEQLEQQLEALKEQVAQEQVTQKQAQPWQPKGSGYYINPMGNAYQSVSDEPTKNFGMEFETKEAAEKAAKAYRSFHRLYKLAEELNGLGWKPDWADGTPKYRLSHDHVESEWTHWITRDEDPIAPVFKDRETAFKAIELIKQGALE